MSIEKINPPSRRRPLAAPVDHSAGSQTEPPETTVEERAGFGNPPRHSRFKPGQSGNPKGRPKRSRGLKTIVREALSQKVIIRTGNAQRRVPHIEAMVLKLIEQASKGNMRALQAVLDQYARAVSDDEPNQSASEPQAPSSTDAAILAALREQIAQELAAGEER